MDCRRKKKVERCSLASQKNNCSMRLIKPAVIGVIVLVAIVMAFSFLFPSNVRVSRAIDIHAPRTQVMQYLNNPERWPEWYNPLRQDSSKSWALVGNTFKRSESALTITSASDTSVMLTAVTPDESQVAYIQVIGTGEDGHCTVQWYSDIPVRWYPWEKFGSIFFDKIIGGGMEGSLQELKSVSEQP